MFMQLSIVNENANYFGSSKNVNSGDMFKKEANHVEIHIIHCVSINSFFIVRRWTHNLKVVGSKPSPCKSRITTLGMI